MPEPPTVPPALPVPIPKSYDEKRVNANFWPKLKRVAAMVPGVSDVLALYYYMNSEKAPLKHKISILATLAYFIMPLDAVPDFIGALGYVDDVAVAHDVPLALRAQRRLLARLRQAARAHQVVVGHDLGADEALLQVAVDRTRRGSRGRRAADGPCAAFVLADREERDLAQQVVGAADHPLECGFVYTQVRTKCDRVFAVELRDKLPITWARIKASQ